MRRVGWVAWSLTALTAGALIVPLAVVIAASFNPTNELAVPPHGLALTWYANILRRPAFLTSFRLSLLLAVVSTACALVMGLLGAVALVRYRFPTRQLFAALLMSPLIVPQVVIGMALLVLLSTLGIVSSMAGLLLLHVMLTLPYTVRVLTAALVRVPESLEDAAVVHGAPRAIAFLLVTVAAIRPGLVAATIFAFVTSFDNFTASQFLVWDRTTLPIEIYSYIRTENDPTVAAISTLLVLATVALVVLVERWVGLEAVTG
jgi:putative spermidine/putrescine transport system permease protein